MIGDVASYQLMILRMLLVPFVLLGSPSSSGKGSGKGGMYTWDGGCRLDGLPFVYSSSSRLSTPS